MSLLLLYAASLIAAFLGWYACGPIKSRNARCILRASLIAILCAPGLVIGHGFAIVPTLFALAVQPSVFTLGSIGLVWLAALGFVFGIPVLRRQENPWPPSLGELFIDGYVGKYLLFGVVSAAILGPTLYADETLAIQTLRYASFLGGAASSFVLCLQASKLKNANPFLTPALFSAPVVFIAAAPAVVLWYGGGVVGALAGRGLGRIAAWVSSAVLTVMAANFGERSYRAVDAPAHVRIEGGVAGNAALAALSIGLAIISWWLLRRYSRRTDEEDSARRTGAHSRTGHSDSASRS